MERIEKPGNLGAILRSADATGVAALLLADSKTDLYNPNTIRASLGTAFSVPCVATTAVEALKWLDTHGFDILACQVGGATHYTSAQLGPRSAFVLGSEANGLSPAWTRADIQSISLPMHGIADSLNVSATAAVLFYEAIRPTDNDEIPNDG